MISFAALRITLTVNQLLQVGQVIVPSLRHLSSIFCLFLSRSRSQEACE
jgi:hypothetical protein